MIEINISKILKLVLEDKKKVLIYATCSAILGVLIAFTIPKKYKTTVVLAPESSGSLLNGNLSSLASLVGVDMKLGQSEDAIYPEIYPDLMESSDFIVDLFDVEVTKDKTGEKLTYFDYLFNHQKHAFYEYPIIALVWVKTALTFEKEGKAPGENVDPFRLTKTETDMVKKIRAHIKCNVDKKTDVISITVEDQDPLISATIADSVQNHLQMAIIDYRTKKARVDLEFINKLFVESKKDYDLARKAFSEYADSHQRISLQEYKTELDDYQSDMSMKFSIYSTIVEQLQVAKAKLQERTPAFSVIQSASVPAKHSNMPKILVLIIWFILGGLGRTSFILWKNKEIFKN